VLGFFSAVTNLGGLSVNKQRVNKQRVNKQRVNKQLREGPTKFVSGPAVTPCLRQTIEASQSESPELSEQAFCWRLIQ
jgi:hypothetical protein